MLLRLKPGAVEDWHNAPRPWYPVVVQGMSEVTISDGEKRRLPKYLENLAPALGISMDVLGAGSVALAWTPPHATAATQTAAMSSRCALSLAGRTRP
jgi:hypothetical protein